MKKIVSIILILAFFVQTTSHFWIVGAFFFNRNYVAANICINRFDAIPLCKGSCVLEKELAADSKKQQDNLPDIKVKELKLFYQTENAVEVKITFSNLQKSHANYNSPIAKSQFLKSVFRPPSVAA